MLTGTPVVALDSTRSAEGMKRMRRNFLIAAICVVFLDTSLMLFSAPSTPEYSIEAIRYATAPDVHVSDLVVGGPKEEKIDIACVVWLIRGGGRTILFDSGYHRTYISMLERGLMNPSLKTILQLASALSTTGADIVARVEARLSPKQTSV